MKKRTILAILVAVGWVSFAGAADTMWEVYCTNESRVVYVSGDSADANHQAQVHSFQTAHTVITRKQGG